MKNSLCYRVLLHDPAAHLFAVTLTLPEPAADGQILQLPAWIPGSYLLREFARNIVDIHASANGRAVTLTKLDKHTWRAARCHAPLVVQYQVYAWDLSVRGAHLDQSHAFFNGSSLFLRALGHEEQSHTVELVRPAQRRHRSWRVATALPEHGAPRYGFGTYQAANYDELIDHPVEIGDFELATFDVDGVPHELAISGPVPNLDSARICTDLQKICATQIALYEPRTRTAPMARYVFLLRVVGSGYGGLEHRASSALICARADLPVLGQPQQSDAYRGFLGLCSHEYFHTWNIKRIKPAVFAPYDLQHENYTSLLWWFEGATSYYDDLMLVRSGAIDQAAYLALLAKTINNVLRGGGRHRQSVAESSFDAWIKYYRQDENAPNAIVSYYTKGALLALALDLTIRADSNGRHALDDVLRLLWQRYGRDFYGAGGAQGVGEAELFQAFDDATGLQLAPTLRRYVHGRADLPLLRLLATVGVAYGAPPAATTPQLGMRTTVSGAECRIANVYHGGAAHLAGLAAGDLLVAFDGLRVEGANLERLLARYRIGDVVPLHVFRRDELLLCNLTLTAVAAPPQVSLTALAKPAALVRRRTAWLQAGTPRLRRR